MRHCVHNVVKHLYVKNDFLSISVAYLPNIAKFIYEFCKQYLSLIDSEKDLMQHDKATQNSTIIVKLPDKIYWW